MVLRRVFGDDAQIERGGARGVGRGGEFLLGELHEEHVETAPIGVGVRTRAQGFGQACEVAAQVGDLLADADGFGGHRKPRALAHTRPLPRFCLSLPNHLRQ